MEGYTMNLLEINTTKLEGEISNIIGIPVKFEKSLYESKNSGGKTLQLISQELVNFSGVFSSIMESVMIETGSSSVYTAGENDREDLRGDTMVWMTIGFSYKFKSGGRNGNNLFHVWYSITKDKWFVMRANERDLKEL